MVGAAKLAPGLEGRVSVSKLDSVRGVTMSNFQWFSPLGISVLLFLLHGILMVIAGGGFLFFYRNLGETRKQGILMSERMDRAFFGRSAIEIYRDNPELLTIVDLLMDVRTGLWLAFGIFELTVTWYALGAGQMWALWTLFVANFGMWLGYAAVSLRFIQRGVRLGLDVPPVIFGIPTILIPIATVLGWVGLR